MTLPTPLFKIEIRGSKDRGRLALATTRMLGVIPKELYQANLEGAEIIRDEAREKAFSLGRPRQPTIIPIDIAKSGPTLWIGGSRRIGRKKKPAFKLVYGAEFGARKLRQYRPWIGSTGYFFFPSIRSTEAERTVRYRAALDAVARAWSRA